MIRVSCPKCKAILQVEDQHAGKVIACSRCKTLAEVAAGSTGPVSFAIREFRNKQADTPAAQPAKSVPVFDYNSSETIHKPPKERRRHARKEALKSRRKRLWQIETHLAKSSPLRSKQR